MVGLPPRPGKPVRSSRVVSKASIRQAFAAFLLCVIGLQPLASEAGKPLWFFWKLRWTTLHHSERQDMTAAPWIMNFQSFTNR